MFPEPISPYGHGRQVLKITAVGLLRLTLTVRRAVDNFARQRFVTAPPRRPSFRPRLSGFIPPMFSRLLIPMLLTGALALACGPRSRSEASVRSASAHESMREDTGVARAASRARRAKHDGELVPTLAVATNGHAVRFALALENAGNKTLEMHFPNGQTHDLVVLDAAGREIWRWSQGRMFTQAHKTEVVSGGDTFRLEEEWTAPAPGQYTVVATLRSTNFPVEQRAAFTAE